MLIKDIRPSKADEQKLVISIQSEANDWKTCRNLRFIAAECLEKKDYHELCKLQRRLIATSDDNHREDHPDYDDDLEWESTKRITIGIDEANILIGHLTEVLGRGIEAFFDNVIDAAIADDYHEDERHSKSNE